MKLLWPIEPGDVIADKYGAYLVVVAGEPYDPDDEWCVSRHLSAQDATVVWEHGIFECWTIYNGNEDYLTEDYLTITTQARVVL